MIVHGCLAVSRLLEMTVARVYDCAVMFIVLKLTLAPYI